MFTKKRQPEPATPDKLLERLKVIADRPTPQVYSEIGGRVQRASRQAVYRQATATLEGGEVLPVVIRNLGSSGCRIEFFRQTPLTGRILIDESSLPLHFWAEVVWQGDGAAGLRLLKLQDGEAD
jgi:hypothetical protein